MSDANDLPPFRSDSKCPKCGCDLADAQYVCQTEFRRADDREYLSRTCSRCGYTRKEACIDSTPAAVAEASGWCVGARVAYNSASTEFTGTITSLHWVLRDPDVVDGIMVRTDEGLDRRVSGQSLQNLRLLPPIPVTTGSSQPAPKFALGQRVRTYYKSWLRGRVVACRTEFHYVIDREGAYDSIPESHLVAEEPAPQGE